MHSVESLTFKTFVLLALLLGGCASVPQENPADIAGLRAQAAQALERGDMSRALSLLREALRSDPNDLDSLRQAERLFGRLGDKAGQREAAQRIAALSPQDPAALERLGLLALEQGRLREAAGYLNGAAEGDASRWEAWNGLGVIADVEGRYEEARAHFRIALALVPGHPKILANLGWSHLLDGDYTTAESLMRQSLETAPDSRVTRSNLAFCLALQGRYAEAKRRYAELYGEAVAANNVGYAALLRRDGEGARNHLQSAMHLKPSFYRKAAANLRQLESRGDLAAAGK